ncbi:alpha/beta hydrolase [Microbulbifer epialgicus]|uniref:Alpha/beta hydrolase n=1 Tax=Microbulbifer epialgicus TaxID=393907 RepID=A0ABV4P685_9GAMM
MRVVLIALLFVSQFSFGGSERFVLSSEYLNEDVNIQVSLPDTYNHSERFRYPVLIVLDGSTQFEHIAGSVKFLSTYAIIPELIVVGVSANNRLKYFSHTQVEKFVDRSGKAELYTKFLQDELLIRLSSKYRTAPYNLISGHSLSGLYTSYLALSESSEFNAFISISPSLWWDNSELVRNYAKYNENRGRPPVRWFLSMASETDEMKISFDAMLNNLTTNNPDNITWFHSRFPNETHDSTPLIGNGQGLQALFEGWNAVPEVDVMSLEQLQKFYLDKESEYGYLFPLSVHQFNVYGLKATYEGKTEWGVEILKSGVKTFDSSEILWDSLATAYSLNGDLDKALNASEKALGIAKRTKSIFLGEIVSQNESLKAKVSRKQEEKR